MSGYRFDRLRLLVIDDNAYMRKLISTILRAFGVANVYEADSAKAAWQAMRDVNPDVLFMDWMTDGKSGIELVRMIRTSAASPNPFVPIIMLSGHTQLGRVQEARDAGCNEFLAKPVSVNSIMTRLISVIENPRPFVRTKSYFGPCRRRREHENYLGPERRAAESTATATESNPFDAVA
ncbi:MAG: response regulator [Alphaproteobacteria bacterium]|nr:response regulator [Alphaproteobacteria bacterium]